MNVSLVFAPSLCMPGPLYLALPTLAAVLKQDGHEVRCFDLNVAAADMLLTDERADRCLRELRDRIASGETHLEGILRASGEKVRAGQASKELLRDPVRFYDRALFRPAFENVVDALGFFYQLDPVISPYRENFARDILENQRRDDWTPMQDLWNEGLLDEVLAADPEVVGVCLAYPEQAAEAMRLARRLRERRPHVFLALGGPLLTVRPEQWLEDGWLFRFFDAAVIGDGSRAFPALVAAIAGHGDLDSVPNLARLDARGKVRHGVGEPVLDDLLTLPPPDFSAADMTKGFTPEPIYPLQLSRGCYWGRCAFCSIGWQENFRLVPAERVRELAIDLARTHGARFVQVQDSGISPRSARQLATVIAEEQLDLHWCAGMRPTPHFLDPDFCALLGRGGCRTIMLGMETVNQAVLDLMNKGFRMEELPTMFTNLRGAKVSVEVLWFVGFPTEDLDGAARTVRWLSENRDLYGMTCYVGDYRIHPDTVVFSDPGRFGVTILEHQGESCRYHVAEGIQPDELAVIKPILDSQNNRTLVACSTHLLHLVKNGLDLTGIEFPATVPPELEAHRRRAADF